MAAIIHPPWTLGLETPAPIHRIQRSTPIEAQIFAAITAGERVSADSNSRDLIVMLYKPSTRGSARCTWTYYGLFVQVPCNRAESQ